MSRSNEAAPVLIGLAALRGGLSLIAIPLAPFLYREHIALLVLLRPTKEVFLLAGYMAEDGRMSLPVIVAAAIPLLIFGVWIFYALGRAYNDEIAHTELPGLAGRVLPAKRIRSLTGAVDAGGARFVYLGRLAAFPSSLVAAACGSAEVPTRTFCLADGLGAMTSLIACVTAGYLLEEAYDDAAPWFTVVALTTLAGAVLLLGRYLRKAAESS